MFRRGYDNLKGLIINKDKHIDGLYFFITASLILFLLAIIFGITYLHGIIGFFLITIICIFFVMLELLILSVTRRKKLLAALLVLSVVPQVNLLELSADTVSYCIEPNHPYWETTALGEPREYNGVPVTLMLLYKQGYNPCKIPRDFLYQDYRLRNQSDEHGRLFDWFK
jgi:hypothetical protein